MEFEHEWMEKVWGGIFACIQGPVWQCNHTNLIDQTKQLLSLAEMSWPTFLERHISAI